MNSHFGDRLVNAIREKNAPVCVGLDPLVERFPPNLLKEHGIALPGDGGEPVDASIEAITSATYAFGREVISSVAGHVPAVKINIAFFERYYADGVRVYGRLVRYAQELGLIVIGDVKRADIGHSTTQYARAQLSAVDRRDVAEIATPDAVTVNPYFGLDGIRPFVEIAKESGRGLIVLVQTSNESAAEVQGLKLLDGSTVCEQVAKLVQRWALEEGLIGDQGYSCISAVVSPRDLESTVRIRALMPNCIFLVPGFGAQGRTAGEVAKCFKPDGTGALVNASRSVIYAYKQPQYRDEHGDDWKGAVEQACTDFIGAVLSALGHDPTGR